MNCVKAYKDGVSLSVHAQPKASRTAIRGLYADSLKVAIQSQPVEGAANEELRRFLAKFFDRPFRSVEIVRGETSREKIIYIPEISLDDAIRLLEKALELKK